MCEDILKYEYIAKTAAYKCLGVNKSHLDDCIQVGLITISNCLIKYDKDKGVKLETYLYSCVRNRIINYIRDMKVFKDLYVFDQGGVPETKSSSFFMFEFIDSLDSFEKDIFHEFYIEQTTPEKIARTNKISTDKLGEIIHEIKSKINKDLYV